MSALLPTMAQLIDLGADFDQFDDMAATTYYENVCRNGCLFCGRLCQARLAADSLLGHDRYGLFSGIPPSTGIIELGTKTGCGIPRTDHGKIRALSRRGPRKQAAVA